MKKIKENEGENWMKYYSFMLAEKKKNQKLFI